MSSSAHWDEAAEEARLRDMERERAAAQARGSADYYAVLNVSRQAEPDAIRDAYKRLSRLFHPDRHRTAEQREWAQHQFHAISRAYQVLSDPHTRALYDQLGEEGVQAATAVGYKVQSRNDLLDAFEREARKRRIEEIEQWVRSKSTVAVSIDAAPVASPLVRSALHARGMAASAWSMAGVSSLRMKHSFAADLATGLSGKITGQMGAAKGRGAGNVVGSLDYALSPHMQLSVSVPALPPHAVTAKVTSQPSLDMVYSVEAVQHTPTLATPPALTVYAGRLLFGVTTGFVMARTGNQYALGPFWTNSPTRRSAAAAAAAAPKAAPKAAPLRPAPPVPRVSSSVTIGLATVHDRHGTFGVDVTASPESSYITAKHTYQLDTHFSVVVGGTLVGVGAPMPAGPLHRIDSDDDDNGRTAAAQILPATGLQRIGDISANIEILAEVDSWTKLGWKVDVSIASGVSATISVHRLGHKIRLPVNLTPVLELEVAVCAILLPLAAALGAHYGLLKPRRRRLIRQRMRELEEEHQEDLALQRRRAGEAVRLMAASVERARAAARAADGLVIETAVYGDLPAAAARDAAGSPRTCDVTLALHALVVDDQLVIAPSESRHSLPGFYDPAFGVRKSLYVRYRFRGRIHEAVVKDSEALTIPLRSHCVEPA
ncbi:hypothetical protein H4R18_001296 [Coemansia javaensis]|uniref:J domain-containing protein n=1 Tax=Coemansia javaensis TaxID=2761396 RepID=A0A9W8LKW5_9FUNG|nr:hypothetical protein H4R18_001296 [Coemansia javaensis]